MNSAAAKFEHEAFLGCRVAQWTRATCDSGVGQRLEAEVTPDAMLHVHQRNPLLQLR
jgi:hypothetical protein